MTRIEYSADQLEAFERIRDWWEFSPEQSFVLAGYAGTGKSTITGALASVLGCNIAFATPTGKAAQRLRELGNEATTIHRLAYTFRMKLMSKLLFEYTGLKTDADLIVIDEASMVDQRVHLDLMASGKRFIFVGDHGQLRPVGVDPKIMAEPDFTLTEIHRQDDTGLLNFASALRNGQRPSPAMTAGGIQVIPNREDQRFKEAFVDANIVLCFANKTRHWINSTLFKARGLLPADSVPESWYMLRNLAYARQSFPVVCLRNNYQYGVFNGEVMSFKIKGFSNEEDPVYWHGDLDDGKTIHRGVTLHKDGFNSTTLTLPDTLDPDVMLFDFGACLTVHKAQGSEWDSIVVWDDTGVWLREYPRWAYTAATRAKSRLTWLTG